MKSARWILFTVVFSLGIGALAAGPALASREAQPLARVGDFTITTDEVRIELAIMEKARQGRGNVQILRSDQVLRRLVENELLAQEGYRMGLADDPQIVNQIKNARRQKSMTTMLDSVAWTIPDDIPDYMEKRKALVKDFVKGLYTKYDVQVDSTLLKSLDYASGDSQVQEYLRSSDDVLATFAESKLRVRNLSRVIAFEEFHGMLDDPRAPTKRDDHFQKYLEEALLWLEAQDRGFPQHEKVRNLTEKMEKDLVKERALGILLEVEFEPTPKELQEYYESHLDEFMGPLQLKMDSVRFNDEQSALDFRKRVLAGGELDWLRRNDPKLADTTPPFPDEWFEPHKMGLEVEDARQGYCPEPYGVPGGWVVAQITEVREPAPLPLEQCKGKVREGLRRQFFQDYMKMVMERLAEGSDVEYLPGAEERVQAVLDEVTNRWRTEAQANAAGKDNR